MDELNQVEYSEWLRWCGYEDAINHSRPIDDDPDYMAGYGEGYVELQMEDNHEVQ